MTTYTIHDNVPVPEIPRVGRKGVEYPFGNLTVGKSFFVLLENRTAKQLKSLLYVRSVRWKKSVGADERKFRFAEMTDPETLSPAVGVWRVA